MPEGTERICLATLKAMEGQEVGDAFDAIALVISFLCRDRALSEADKQIFLGRIHLFLDAADDCPQARHFGSMSLKRKKLTANQREQLFEEHKGICWRCQQPINRVKEQWHVGHIIDLACGGSDDWANIAPEHRGCNKGYADIMGNAMAAKIKRVRHRHMGNREPRIKISRKFDGTIRRWTPEGGWEDVT